MAMIEGSVSINPVTGAATGAGAAKEVFDALDATIDYGGQTGPALAVARKGPADLAEAIAKIIPHIVANAVVSTNVSTTVAAPIPVTVAIPGGTGGTTAPGTGTGTGSGTVS